MANTTSAKKAARKIARRATVNKARRSRMRSGSAKWRRRSPPAIRRSHERL